MPDRFGRNAFAGIVLVIAMLHLLPYVAVLANAFELQRLDLSPARTIAQGFRTIVRADEKALVHIDVPLPPVLKERTEMLFPYFARTGWLWQSSSDPYPRDRLFSLPQCPATHAIVPDTAADHPAGAKLGTYVVSGIGTLAVYRLPPQGKPAGRFC